MCSRLFTDRNVSTKTGEPICVCGTGAWFESRSTIWEIIGFLVGYHKAADMGPLVAVSHALGGNSECAYATRSVAMEKR
jgi:hypothetical protein